MRIYLSEETDPAINAAMEEWLLRESGGVKEPSFMIYANKPSVLMGRNQNVLAECNEAYCRENGITVMRRISGGGTVYHDMGNLNLALVTPRQDYSPDAFTAFLTELLVELGAPVVTVDNSHSVFSQGLKLCGTAYALTSGGALMHGCILVTTDIERLQLALTPSSTATQGGPRGVPSRRVPVTRLADIIGEITAEDVAALSLSRMMEHHPGSEALPLAAADLTGNQNYQEYLAKFRDHAWNWRS
jgi:lipoate-protein ligase A